MSKLNERQRKFIEAYMSHGNGAQAAIDAGYSASRAASTASRLLATNGKVKKALEKRQQQDPAVATREARQKFWTDTMQDESLDMSHRLRASELLGKSGGDFVQRSEHTGEVIIRVRRGS